MDDMSMFGNLSQLIFIWGIVGFLYLAFTIVSSRRIMKNKFLRRFGKKVRKHRLRFTIINDVFWITYIYSMFIGGYQLRTASF